MSSRLALRWNGDVNDSEDKGSPNFFSKPMWFQLPHNFKKIMQEVLVSSEM